VFLTDKRVCLCSSEPNKAEEAAPEPAPEEPAVEIPSVQIDIGEIAFDESAAKAAPSIPLAEDPSRPSVWSGVIKYETMADLNVRAYHVSGDALPSSLLPQAWNITSRANLAETLKYLPKIDMSSSRKRITVFFEPQSDQDLATYQVRCLHHDGGFEPFVSEVADSLFYSEND
jgi:hypothetical protein